METKATSTAWLCKTDGKLVEASDRQHGYKELLLKSVPTSFSFDFNNKNSCSNLLLPGRICYDLPVGRIRIFNILTVSLLYLPSDSYQVFICVVYGQFVMFILLAHLRDCCCPACLRARWDPWTGSSGRSRSPRPSYPPRTVWEVAQGCTEIFIYSLRIQPF